MLRDIVIDTNVLMHADNPNEKMQGDAAKLIEAVRNSQTKLCVDQLAQLDEAKNRSQIVSEYLRHLKEQSVGRRFLAFIFSTGRHIERSRSVDGATGNFINQQVPDKTDRVFVKVAVNSDDKVLVCHDFGDVSKRARKEILDRLDVTVADAKKVKTLVG